MAWKIDQAIVDQLDSAHTAFVDEIQRVQNEYDDKRDERLETNPDWEETEEAERITDWLSMLEYKCEELADLQDEVDGISDMNDYTGEVTG